MPSILSRLLPALLPALMVAACAPPAPEGGESRQDASPAVLEPAAPVADADLAELKSRLEARLPGVPIDAVRATPMPGVFEVQSGLVFGYTSADGRYLIEGDLNDLSSGTQLTEVRRRDARHDMLAAIPEADSILYAPEGDTLHTVTVFTDIDCGYCRKLHQHIAEYNADGIAVRYLFFPRSGPDTESFHKAERVWCAQDRNQALTQAKLGGGFQGAGECSNPVMEHLRLAAQLGLRGTPAIFLPDGEIIPGYRTPEQLRGDLAGMNATGPG